MSGSTSPPPITNPDGGLPVHQVNSVPAGNATIGAVRVSDGSTNALVTVAVLHTGDNQSPGGAAAAMLTGGVAQIINAAGTLNRQRETAFDGVPAAGIATGTQQLAGPFLATTVTSGAITANAGAQGATLAAASFTNRGVTVAFQSGTMLLVDVGGANQESVYVISIAGTTIQAVFTKAHAAGIAVGAFSYSQQRDSTIPDGSSPAGIGASGAYLFNAGLNTVEFERSFLGELMGARGTGAAVAVEYEDAAGGPPLASGVSSGLRLMPGQALVGVGLATGAITASAVGNGSVVFASAAATNMIPPGHVLQLSGGGATETVFVSQTFVPGSSATVPLVSPVVNAGQTTAKWPTYAPNGPALAGFLAYGIGIEEEAVYDPVSGLFYLERSATQDGVAPQNVVMESPALWNGSGMDRWPGTAAQGGKVLSRPGVLVPVDPAVGSITTGGTAVNAFTAGQCVAGGLLKNTGTSAMYVRLTGAAGVTEASGSLAVAAGQTYSVPPVAGAVSVNATDAGHTFTGVGFQ